MILTLRCAIYRVLHCGLGYPIVKCCPIMAAAELTSSTLLWCFFASLNVGCAMGNLLDCLAMPCVLGPCLTLLAGVLYVVVAHRTAMCCVIVILLAHRSVSCVNGF